MYATYVIHIDAAAASSSNCVKAVHSACVISWSFAKPTMQCTSIFASGFWVRVKNHCCTGCTPFTPHGRIGMQTCKQASMQLQALLHVPGSHGLVSHMLTDLPHHAMYNGIIWFGSFCEAMAADDMIHPPHSQLMHLKAVRFGHSR